MFGKSKSAPKTIDQIQFSIKLPNLLREIIFVWSYAILIFIFVGLSSSTSAQLSKIDSLFEILKNSKPDTNQVKTLYFLTQSLNETKPSQALIYAKQGLELAQLLRFKSGQSISLNALALSYYQMGNFDSAMTNFEKEFDIVSKMKDSIRIAGVFDNMSTVYIHWGDLNKALELRKKENRFYAAHNKKALLASGYTWIGNIYKEQGEYPNALEYYLKAVKIYETENNNQDIGIPLINISSIYRYLKKYDQANKYALDAKAIFEKTGNDKGIGVSLYRIALICDEEGDFENTIRTLDEAKEIFEKIEDSYNITLVNLQLGNTYRSVKQDELALKYFKTALPIAKKIGDKSLIASILENIGTVFCDKSDFLNGLKYIHKSEKIFEELNDKHSIRSTISSFIEIYSHINQPDSIVRYFQKYQQLTDSLYSEQSTTAIAEAQTKYETEKKEKEIVTLNFRAQKQKYTMWFIASGFGVLLVSSGSGFWVFSNKKKREQLFLQQQVTEHDMKALRAQMNPHFIFNCVDSIERLLDEAKIIDSKDSLLKFSSLTRTVLENSTKREILLSEEIETVRLYMNLENRRFKKPFTYEIVIDADLDPETTLIPPLILQPFVENAIKHGFRDPEKEGLLKIEIQNKNEFLVCIIEDNGIGRSESMKIKSLSGFKKESIGMKLTEERLQTISKMKKVKSHFLIDDLVDCNYQPLGTRVKIFLPYELSI